jgi:putative ABC transport system permease protein
MSAAAIRPSSLQPRDVLRVGLVGLKTRRLRAVLSVLGVALGIASMVAVMGISSSSRADLLAALDKLGTNLLVVQPGQSFTPGAGTSTLPSTANAMVNHTDGVLTASTLENIDGLTVRRSDHIDKAITNALNVGAVRPTLGQTVGATLQDGAFLNSATAHYPAVVLGATAAARLGIDKVGEGVQVWINDRWYTVVGILNPVTLAPELDSYALVGLDYAEQALGADDSPSSVYVRADTDRVNEVSSVLGASANPEHPEEVEVSRPSDALEARAKAKTAFTSLFLGLGAVALFVGGVGIANVMVISVLERRSEIGLRRALGATRRHIAVQFLTESMLLGTMGGAAGALIGVLVTAGYDANRGWPVSMPAYAVGGALGCAVVIGALAGAYPALRGARVAPTTALRTA